MATKPRVTKPKETKELTLPERAQQALSVEYTETKLKALAKKSTDLKEIKDDTDYELVKRSALDLVGVRTTIEKAGKVARDDANKFSKAVIAEEKRLLAIITPEEDRLKALRKEVDDRKKLEEEEAIQKEEDRIRLIELKINGLMLMTEGLLGADAATLQERLTRVASMDITEEEYDEFCEPAALAKDKAEDVLGRALKDRIHFEEQKAEQDRVATEQAESARKFAEQQEAEKKANDERQKKLDDQQAEIDRQKREAKEAEEKVAREAQEKKDAEEAEERRKAEAVKREAEEKESAKKRAAEMEAEKQRKEAMRPDVERTAEWLKKLRFIDGPGDITNAECTEIVAHVLHQLDLVARNSLSVLEDL